MLKKWKKNRRTKDEIFGSPILFSLFYCSDIRVSYHKIASNSVQRYYNDYGKIVDINNNIKAIQIVAGNGINGVLNKLIYVQSVLRRGNLEEISIKISKNIANLRKILAE